MLVRPWQSGDLQYIVRKPNIEYTHRSTCVLRLIKLLHKRLSSKRNLTKLYGFHLSRNAQAEMRRQTC
jgi:hypothetical protein